MKLIGIPEDESETRNESSDIIKFQANNSLQIPEDLDSEHGH